MRTGGSLHEAEFRSFDSLKILQTLVSFTIKYCNPMLFSNFYHFENSLYTCTVSFYAVFGAFSPMTSFSVLYNVITKESNGNKNVRT